MKLPTVSRLLVLLMDDFSHDFIETDGLDLRPIEVGRCRMGDLLSNTIRNT
jgi:hypothetical protein